MQYATAEEERDALDTTLDDLAEQLLPGAPWQPGINGPTGCGAVAPSTTFQYSLARRIDLDQLDSTASADLAEQSSATLEGAGFRQKDERDNGRNLVRDYERDGVKVSVILNETRLTLATNTSCLPSGE